MSHYIWAYYWKVVCHIRLNDTKMMSREEKKLVWNLRTYKKMWGNGGGMNVTKY